MCRSPSWWWCHPCQEQFSSHLRSHRGSIPSRGCRRSSECFSKLIFFLRMNYVHFLPWTQEEGKLQECAGDEGSRRGWVESPSPAPQTPLCSETSPRSTSALGKEREKEERKEMDDQLVEEQSRDICVLKSFWNLQLSVFWKTHLVAPSYHEFSISLLPFRTVSQDFCAQGESNVAVSDTTEQKTNIFAAVNKPTSFFKDFFLFLKREITLILGSKPRPRDTMQQNHHCLGGGAEVFYIYIFF